MNIRGYEFEDMSIAYMEETFPGFLNRIVDIRPGKRNTKERFGTIIELDDGSEIIYHASGMVGLSSKTVKNIWYKKFGDTFSYWFNERFPNEYDAGSDNRKLDVIHFRTGISKIRLNKFLNGSDVPTSYELHELASFFYCTPNDLLK